MYSQTVYTVTEPDGSVWEVTPVFRWGIVDGLRALMQMRINRETKEVKWFEIGTNLEEA